MLIFTRRIGGRDEDFFASMRSDTGWSVARSLGPPINTELNEGAQRLSADGRLLFLTICHREDGFGGCDLYVAERLADGRWSAARNLGPGINTSPWDSQPCLAADGSDPLLYEQPARRKRDGWSSGNPRRDLRGAWTKPVNLGPAINTAGSEQSPFLHPDGATLYFSSDGHPGMGDADLFVARRGLDGEWSAPQNLGYPINTAETRTAASP